MSDSGELLADADGRTLYVQNLTRLKPGYSRAWETPHLWRLVVAGAADRATGQWAIVARDDGARQWTFKGMPLFTHVLDDEPGALHGNSNTDRIWQTIMASGQSMPGAVN
jgi:predicted lipoprotein with Yx(FWY)xxD motif